MSEAIETIDYRGYKIKIYQDEGYNISPDEDKNEDLFLVGYHRDFTVERDDVLTKRICQVVMGDEPDDDEQRQEAKDIKKKYHVFGLEAYIHSGVSLALSREGNFCDRQWDVSQLGAVFVGKEVWKGKKKAREVALSLIEEWNSYLSGEVYGYVLEDKEENMLDSCWGYVGDIKYCIEEAERVCNHYPEQLVLPL